MLFRCSFFAGIKDTSKVVSLRKLDTKAKLPATVFTYTFGIITALIADVEPIMEGYKTGKQLITYLYKPTLCNMKVWMKLLVKKKGPYPFWI